jgi:hypothetical protein
MRKIGFSHGVLFKLHDVNKELNIRLLQNCGANAIEINCHSHKDLAFLPALLPYIQSFEHVSLHAPCDVRYDCNENTKILLKKLKNFYIRSGAELIVVHPDLVDDWSVFDKFKMKWAIENMDDRKKNFKDVNDLKLFFNEYREWSLVLDLGHCNSNDKSMILAEDLIREFQDRIVEIHLSGYKKFHDPLYRTKQTEIIKYCQNLAVPIIIESVFEVDDGFEGVQEEFEYVVKNLK